MLKRFHKIARILAVLILLIVIAGVGAPYLRADYFAARIQAGLEHSLGRKVTIGNARYNVFTGPGFQVEEVTIAEDPRIGIEPFAHVSEVHARVDVWSLFSGQIRFSNLRLVEPTVNFARTDDGQWNVELFLERTSAAQLPPIQIRQGRVNFKFADRKAIPYLGNADVDIAPGSSGSSLQMVASAEPFRTDRPAVTVGRFHLRTRLYNGQLDGELEAERASIPEIARLLGARDPGLKGFVSAAFQLSGPLDAVGVKGQLKLDDLSGGVLLPKSSAGALPVAGKLNLRGHEIELHSDSAPAAALPVTIRVQAKEYFAKPEWSGEIKFEGFAAPAMLEVAKRLGASVPDGFSVEKGSFSGAISFDNVNGLNGDVALTGGELKLPSGGELSGAEFQFEAAGKDAALKIHSAPAEENAAKILIDGKYDLDARTFGVRMQTRSGSLMSIADTVKLVPDTPLLSRFRQGHWRGSLRYASDATAPAWSGQVEVLDGVVEVEGFASPVTLSFVAGLDAGRLTVKTLRGVCGKLAFTGDYRYEPGSVAHPHRLNLAAADLDLGELERILRPTLARGGFLSKTLRIGKAPVPEWLAARKVEGTIRFAKVTAGAGLPKLEKMTGKYQWDGVKAILKDLTAVGADGGATEIDSEVAIDLSGNLPRYKVKGAVSGVQLAGGSFQFEGAFDTEGLGPSLLAKLSSKGEFHAEKVRINPEWMFDEASGNYTASVSGSGQPKITITEMNLTQGAEAYQGQASTQADGRLALDLTGPRKQLKLIGSLTRP